MATVIEASDWSPCMSLTGPDRVELSWRDGDRPGELQLLVSGTICVSSIVYLRPAMSVLLDRHPRMLTLDLSGVTFIDARGVTLFSQLAEYLARWGGTLAIQRPSHEVTRVLDLAGFGVELGMPDETKLAAHA